MSEKEKYKKLVLDGKLIAYYDTDVERSIIFLHPEISELLMSEDNLLDLIQIKEKRKFKFASYLNI